MSAKGKHDWPGLKKHLSWTTQQWQKVYFSDESYFNIQNYNGLNYVKRRPGEDYDCKSLLVHRGESVGDHAD